MATTSRFENHALVWEIRGKLDRECCEGTQILTLFSYFPVLSMAEVILSINSATGIRNPYPKHRNPKRTEFRIALIGLSCMNWNRIQIISSCLEAIDFTDEIVVFLLFRLIFRLYMKTGFKYLLHQAASVCWHKFGGWQNHSNSKRRLYS